MRLNKHLRELASIGASCFVEGFGPFGLLILRFQHGFYYQNRLVGQFEIKAPINVGLEFQTDPLGKIAESGLRAPKSDLSSGSVKGKGQKSRMPTSTKGY